MEILMILLTFIELTVILISLVAGSTMFFSLGIPLLKSLKSDSIYSSLTQPNLTDYCDGCPVRRMCPNEDKEWSK